MFLTNVLKSGHEAVNKTESLPSQFSCCIGESENKQSARKSVMCYEEIKTR